jgi:excisionase family DNA binding protein
MPSGEPTLWTVDEVAQYLRTSRAAVYHQVARGQLPGVVRVGRRVLIKRSVLERALLDETVSDHAGK